MNDARAIRVVVVDDEPLARANIAALLGRDPTVRLIAECGSGSEALATIRDVRPDVVFLDVEMPDHDGFDVLEMLTRDRMPAIVFVTAYDHYAVRAFEAGALDYLLKPFDDARFSRALERAKDRVGRGTGVTLRDTFVVKTNGSIVFLKVADVDWIEAADYYSRLHVGARTHLLRRSLADLEGELEPETFCRVHRSAIVKLAHVAGLVVNESGDYEVLLDDATRVPVSRRYRKRLKTSLDARAV